MTTTASSEACHPAPRTTGRHSGVVREAVVPGRPVGDELTRRHVPDLALGTVGEVKCRRRQALQRDGSPVAGHARRGLDEQCLHVLKLLLGDLTHRVSSLTPLCPAGPLPRDPLVAVLPWPG